MNLSNEVMIFIWILVINAVIAIVYLLVNHANKDMSKPGLYIRFTFMLLCPVIGFIFLGLSQILFKLLFRKPVDLADVIFSKEKVENTVAAEEDWERNIVPIEEAINVTETGTLRSFMMSVVKGDIQHTLASVMLALNSEDPETAHYAAAVLQDELNKFRDRVTKEYKLVMSEDNSSDANACLEKAGSLLNYMDSFLEQKVFSEGEQQEYVDKMSNLGELIYTKDSKRLTSAEIESISLRNMEVKKFDISQRWCNIATELYPNTLATYTSKLKLFFTMGEREKFKEVLGELKASSIVIDSKTMDLIRVFQ